MLRKMGVCRVARPVCQVWAFDGAWAAETNPVSSWTLPTLRWRVTAGAPRVPVGAFLAASRDEHFDRLLAVLSPDIVLQADQLAVSDATVRRRHVAFDLARTLSATGLPGALSAGLPEGQRSREAWTNPLVRQNRLKRF